MRICIVGAGAIGGLLGVALSRSEHEISMVARGATLEAIRERGLRLRSDQEESRARPNCADDPRALGTQDVVILAVKAQQAADAAESIAPLLATETAVVTAMNGLPWWYFYKHGDRYEDRRLESVDPGGRLWRAIHPSRVIGCAVYAAAEPLGPGLIRHVFGDRFIFGEPDGAITPRCLQVQKAFAASGLQAQVRDNIRVELWRKLWGNLSFNPISALTGATLDVIASDAGTRAIARQMMIEAREIGAALGIETGLDLEQRLDAAASVGAHKTSMLQDLERGRSLELDALVTAVQEMGRLVGVDTPYIDAVLALTRQRARTLGLHPAAGTRGGSESPPSRGIAC
ncbi:MAG: 2-dehydropantoate 2-reductase [Kiloniellales bacterium]|nr:2-dehydropantoate 2-reductase [Kiloniellales bacterium]